MQPVYKATTTVLLSKSSTPQAIFGSAESSLLFGQADEINNSKESRPCWQKNDKFEQK